MATNVQLKNYLNFLFDGNNFRGYFSESELIAKAYANNWAASITTATPYGCRTSSSALAICDVIFS